MSEITAVSLFTGAGGMDIGFEHAGVRILCANELNRDACDACAANHPEARLIRGDLAEHMDELKQYRGRRPCVRRNALPGVFGCRKMEQNDARSQLILRFLDVVELLRPRAFVMENVKALAVLKKWEPIRRRYMERVSELGYSCGRLGAECCGLWRSAEQRAGVLCRQRSAHGCCGI